MGRLTINCPVCECKINPKELDDRFLSEQYEGPAQRTDKELFPA